jgi:small neutral amino acid transporter SnatA (MarC family)
MRINSMGSMLRDDRFQVSSGMLLTLIALDLIFKLGKKTG